MPKTNPTAEFDRRLFSVGDGIASGSFRMVDRPRALRFAYLMGISGACGLLLAPFAPVLEWSCYAIAAAATAKVAHLLIDKSTWVERPAPALEARIPSAHQTR